MNIDFGAKCSENVPFCYNTKNIYNQKNIKTGANGSIMSCQRDGREYAVIEN